MKLVVARRALLMRAMPARRARELSTYCFLPGGVPHVLRPPLPLRLKRIGRSHFFVTWRGGSPYPSQCPSLRVRPPAVALPPSSLLNVPTRRRTSAVPCAAIGGSSSVSALLTRQMNWRIHAYWIHSPFRPHAHSICPFRRWLGSSTTFPPRYRGHRYLGAVRIWTSYPPS